MKKYLEKRQAITDAQREREAEEKKIDQSIASFETSQYTVNFENGAFQFCRKTGNGTSQVWIHLEIEQLRLVTDVGNRVFDSKEDHVDHPYSKDKPHFKWLKGTPHMRFQCSECECVFLEDELAHHETVCHKE